MDEKAKILVTGGAGLIGSALIRWILGQTNWSVLNLDKLTYAASPEALASVEGDARYRFEKVDICDRNAVKACFDTFTPDAVVHLAAESHVDRSIDGPAEFVMTNMVGTYQMLDASLEYWNGLTDDRRDRFRFLHISTDEVYGSLQPGEWFVPQSPYRPNSPYSASKAGADHLVRAWHKTYGLPTIVSNCSNNYGPFQFPEKLIPLTVIKALSGETIPVYGNGENERDWLFVDDHAAALSTMITSGRAGAVYLVGSGKPARNIDIVRKICGLLDSERPADRPRADQIAFVADRPGHDQRYAIDAAATTAELGWKPMVGLEEGLAQTVKWYLDHEDWWRAILAQRYDGARLGNRDVDREDTD